MFGDPEKELEFRPKSYWLGAREMEYPLLGQAPGFGGGSYLPRLRTAEVEIAGVALDSTTGDVISIRAQPVPEGIRFRVVDEYRSRFKIKNPVRDAPLSLGELADLIDTAEHDGQIGLVWGLLDAYWVEGMDKQGDPAELQEFAVVVSPFYPQLEALYRQRAQAWVQRKRMEPRGDVEPGQQEVGL